MTKKNLHGQHTHHLEHLWVGLAKLKAQHMPDVAKIAAIEAEIEATQKRIARSIRAKMEIPNANRPV